MNFKTADLCDEHSDNLQICQQNYRSYGARRIFAGPVSTVKCFEDNSRVKEAVGEAGHGRVLVVDAGGSHRCAVLGDLLAKQAAENGWAGVIVHGCIRDSEDIGGFDLGVLALGTMPLKSVRKGEGQRDIPIVIGGAKVQPGNWAYVDSDGVIFAPAPIHD